MGSKFTLLVACAVLSATAIVHAAESSASLSVTRAPGAESCIEDKPLERAVTSRMRRNPFGAGVSDLAIRVRFERDDTRWVAVLDMEDSSGAPLGRRTLETSATHCSALDDSLALVIALLVQTPPTPAAESEPVPTPAPPAPDAAPPAASPAPPRAKPAATVISVPRETYAPREPWRVAFSGSGVAALGILPRATFGGELGFAIEPPKLPELRLFGTLLAPREQAVSADAGAHFSFVAAGLELCGTPLEGSALAWFACGGQSVGRLHAQAFGFDQNGSDNQLTFALMAHSGIRLSVGSGIALRAAGRAELPLARRNFVYGSRAGTESGIFRMSPLDGVFELGVEVSR
jgi:hypothetical protein